MYKHTFINVLSGKSKLEQTCIYISGKMFSSDTNNPCMVFDKETNLS